MRTHRRRGAGDFPCRTSPRRGDISVRPCAVLVLLYNILYYYANMIYKMLLFGVTMVKTHEQQIAEYDAQIERIKARRHAAVMRQSKAERKARNHALIVAGGLLMACFDGGWRSVDWPSLAALIDGNRHVFA